MGLEQVMLQVVTMSKALNPIGHGYLGFPMEQETSLSHTILTYGIEDVLRCTN